MLGGGAHFGLHFYKKHLFWWVFSEKMIDMISMGQVLF